MRPQAEDLLEKMLEKLSLGEAVKKQELLTRDIKLEYPHCFERIEVTLRKKCIHEKVRVGLSTYKFGFRTHVAVKNAIFLTFVASTNISERLLQDV
jgi:hypothetical protein